jgi:hypothetical protein
MRSSISVSLGFYNRSWTENSVKLAPLAVFVRQTSPKDTPNTRSPMHACSFLAHTVDDQLASKNVSISRKHRACFEAAEDDEKARKLFGTGAFLFSQRPPLCPLAHHTIHGAPRIRAPWKGFRFVSEREVRLCGKHPIGGIAPLC